LRQFAVDNAAASQSRLLVQLRDHQKKSRAALEEWRDLFDKLYENAVRRDFTSRFLVQWFAALLEKERAALERLCPMMDKLQKKLDKRGDRFDPEARELFQESIGTAFDWITPYQTLCTKLLTLAFERRIAAGGVLRAHPVEGDIDHEALSREFIARFPKIRAALAK